MSDTGPESSARPTNKVEIVAEIGANHDGDVDEAHRLVDAAAEAGVDAVKFQTYTSAELVADPDRVVSWGPPGRERSETVGSMFDRLAIPRAAHGELFEHARRLGVTAFSTPFSVDGLDFLLGLDVPAIKIASSDVNHRELLQAAAASGKPLILSTGKATIEEVDRAVETVRDGGASEICLLHCVAQYPAPLEEMNLLAIPKLAERYPDLSVGLSDHSLGSTAAVGAVALGAVMIEKHFTLDKDLPGPDHWFSADPAEMTALVEQVRAIAVALGDGEKRVMPSEQEERRTSIRSLVVRRAMRAGEEVTADDLVALRPGTGIDPFEQPRVVGRRLRIRVEAGTVLRWEDLDG